MAGLSRKMTPGRKLLDEWLSELSQSDIHNRKGFLLVGTNVPTGPLIMKGSFNLLSSGLVIKTVMAILGKV